MNSNKLAVLLAQDIPDSTDFPKKAPFLRQLDDSVCCTICSKYYEGPVSLLCGHSFCSMCIRENLSIKPHCPACRQNATEGNLRPNLVLEEIVSAWKLSRPYVLDLAKQEEARAAEPAKKKRRLSPSCVAGPSRTSSTSSKDSSPSDPPEGDVPKPDSIVNCPVCDRRLKYKEINTHMDNNCAPISSVSAAKSGAPTSKTQKTQWSDLMRGQPPKSKGKGKDKAAEDDDYPLPKVSYDTLKEKQLRDKLAEHGLPTTGDRPVLTRRHQRWTMQWNANLDKSAAKRQTKAELRADLKKWEEQRKNKKEKITVDDSHLKTHREDFKKLVAAAQPVKAKPAVPESSPAAARSSSVAPNPPPESDIIVVDSDDEIGDS
ncbi:hypothetical protein B0H17DRAFT_1043261 [Mycena rosella]|uniref:Postreplication repair E3 ubiquitin-protein ligase RAD18 n=1 Tax=Mycena rosella TaxID=1033263 RepID=A0AAD7E012_MYCRO|nr:hypothetical protein B0H17DRAFT_1043261 [Mycena rosella]